MDSNLDDHVRAYQRESVYDFDNEILLKWYSKRIIEKTLATDSLLELGLGYGFTTEAFSTHFKRHVVIDASPAVISNFLQYYPNSSVEIVESYFEHFDTNEKFDVIVLGYILEHVENPVDIIGRFKRFMKSGGRMFIAVPNSEVLNRKIGHFAGLLPNMQELSEHDLLLGHKRYYTVDSLKRHIEKSGLIIRSIEGIFLKPLTTKQMISLDFDPSIIEAFCRVGMSYPELSSGILAELELGE